MLLSVDPSSGLVIRDARRVVSNRTKPPVLGSLLASQIFRRGIFAMMAVGSSCSTISPLILHGSSLFVADSSGVLKHVAAINSMDTLNARYSGMNPKTSVSSSSLAYCSAWQFIMESYWMFVFLM